MAKKPTLVPELSQKTKPNPDLIERCEALLEDAKSGEIQGMVGIVIFDDNTTSYQWLETVESSRLSVVSDAMVGCLERLKHRLLRIRVNAEEECEDEGYDFIPD